MTENGDPTSAPEGLDWEESPLLVDEVRSLFVTLGKAFRAHQLYDQNNPVRHRFVESLKSEFRDLWSKLEKLVVHIDEERIYLGGSEVYHSDSRKDSLAFLFFKDGLREITFLPGIEEHELETFLGVLQKARKLIPESDDLLTVLWEAEMAFFRYQYIDLLAEGVELPEAGPGADKEVLQRTLAAEDEEMEAQQKAAAHGSEDVAETPQTVQQEDFNPTLYVLDPRDMEALRSEVQNELSRDTRTDVLKALFDRLEESGNRERQSEILAILEVLLPNFLSRGKLVAATNVLLELRRLEELEETFDEQRVAESRRILDEISTPRAIEELMQALYAGTIRASSSQLGNFLQFLRGQALAPLLRESEVVEHKELQTVLRTAVQGIASKNRDALIALLDEEDPLIAAAAAKLAAEMRIAEAGPALARLLAHDEPEVRLAAVEAAVALKAASVAHALEDRLEDPERRVRIAAARAFEALFYSPVAKKLSGIIRSRAIRDADISEKVAMFEAYGTTAGVEGTSLLDGILNRRGGLLGKKESTEMRAAAALGLGRIRTPEARAALEKAAHDEDPVVRSNVNRALREDE